MSASASGGTWRHGGPSAPRNRQETNQSPALVTGARTRRRRTPLGRHPLTGIDRRGRSWQPTTFGPEAFLGCTQGVEAFVAHDGLPGWLGTDAVGSPIRTRRETQEGDTPSIRAASPVRSAPVATTARTAGQAAARSGSARAGGGPRARDRFFATRCGPCTRRSESFIVVRLPSRLRHRGA